MRLKGMATVWLIMMALVGSFSASSLYAQEPDSDPLKDIRSVNDLTPESLQKISAYLDQRLADLESDASPDQATKKFMTALINDYQNGQNSSGFKRQWATQCAAKFAAKIESPHFGWVFVHVLAVFSEPVTLDALKLAAASKNDVIRCLALKAIGKLVPKIESDQPTVSALLSWLKDAAGKEKNSTALGYLYRVFSFNPSHEEQIKTLLAILENRLTALQDDSISGELAEEVAWLRLSELATTIPEADRKKAVQMLAKFLVQYAYRYIYLDLSVDARQSLVKLLTLTENLLARLTTPPTGVGGVATAARSAADDKYDQLKSALVTWVGSGEQPGFLVGTNWQVPVGGGVTNRDFSAPAPRHADDTSHKPSSTP